VETRERAKYRVLLIVLWIVAIVVAAVALDRAVAAAVHQAGIDSFLRAHALVRETLKAPGFYASTVVLAVFVSLSHRLRWQAGLFLLVGGATAGANELIKWIAGRARPFRTLSGDSTVLTPFELHPFPSLSSKNLCFPSGHAALAFATAAALSILWPRWKWTFYAGAVLVAAERVMENAHWFSDAVAAAALGIGGVWVIRRLWWDRFSRNATHG